jgi:nucleotide-binding universal stress UspA family protein
MNKSCATSVVERIMIVRAVWTDRRYSGDVSLITSRRSTRMRIVVGISERDFKTPLHWALDTFDASGSSLLMIHCIVGRLSTEMPYPNDEDVARGRLIVDEAVAFARDCGIDVLGEVREGFAGEMLVESSIDAGLLIIGSSRSHHLLHAPGSSVVTYCVRHARCPLAIVPAD